jgi:hypothetical protein
MAATSWSIAPWLSNHKWLLQDGSIVVTPDLEATTSGRRVRIAGTKESVASKDANDLLAKAIDAIADERGTKRWLRLFPEDEFNSHRSAARMVPHGFEMNAPMDLHLVDPERASGYSESTTVAFEYTSVNVPSLKAYVWIVIHTRNSSSMQLVTSLTYRQTTAGIGEHDRVACYNGTWEIGTYDYYDPSWKSASETIQDFKPILDVEFMARSYEITQRRAAVVKALEMIRVLKDSERIEIPDLRDLGNVQPMEFTLTRSNLTNALYRELVDFVQAEPIMDRIKANYKAILNDLRTLGFVISTDNDVLESMDTDALSELRCAVHPSDDEEVGPRDRFHTAVLDFATGTLIVNCIQPQNQEALHAWEVSKFKAEVSGEIDELLAYVRAHQEPAKQQRIKKILKQRTPTEFVLPQAS